MKKTPRNIARLLSCAFFNKEAYRNLRKLIQDEQPDVVYVLQQINALSPSVFKACSDEGVRVIHRLSDFNMMCPRSDFLCNGKICIECINGTYSKAMRNCCCHGSKATTLVRVASMKFHRMCRLFDIIDAFVSPSRFTACLLEQSGVPSNKVHVIPTFVPWYENKENKKPVEPFVLYLGRISPEKGVDILIKAALSNPSLKVKITGKIDDAYSQSMVKLVEDAGESDRIEFVGFVNGDSKNQLIDEASCVVCPSTWYENMPNAVLEAFAHGKPVVAFDIGCMPEIVEDGITGEIVPLGDENAFGIALQDYTSNKALAATQGKAALKRARTEYSERAHLNKLLDLFSENS